MHLLYLPLANQFPEISERPVNLKIKNLLRFWITQSRWKLQYPSQTCIWYWIHEIIKITCKTRPLYFFSSERHMYEGRSRSFAHLLIFAISVGIIKSMVKRVQLWYLEEKMRHWEAISDLFIGLYKGWNWIHLHTPTFCM